jgi:uncharacterized membrane protein required for colicin V production
MNTDKLPINAFDFIVLGILVFGIFRGRKHGMSEELLMVFKWIAILVGCAFLYQPIGEFFVSTTSVFDLLSCYLMAYATVTLVIVGCFALVKKLLGGKLLGSDIFGGAEYYLGMGAGMLRYTAILLVGLAVLNARYYSPDEVKAMENFQNDVYGSTFFPTLQTVQSFALERSLSGSFIKNNLSFLLIKPTQPQDKTIKQKDYQMPQ